MVVILYYLPKAEGATIDITTDTTWGDRTILPGTVVNVADGATLRIEGDVFNNGDINVYGRVDVTYPYGNLYINKANKEVGTLNIHSGGTVNVENLLRVNGLLEVNSGGTLEVQRAFVLIYGTSNIDGKLDNDGHLQIQSGAVLRVNEPGIVQNNLRIHIYSGGTLNINNGGNSTMKGGELYILPGGTLKVFTGGTLDNNGGTIYKYCGGTFTLNPGSSFTGNPLDGYACIAINNVSLNEGNSGTTTFAFKVTRSGITTGTTTMEFATGSRNSNCWY